MQQVTTLDADHADLLHTLAWDHYGTRLCTCSSDQKLKVWDKGKDSLSPHSAPLDDTGNNTLYLNDAWKAHDSSVLKVAWAHPEYGQVLASCSFDRSVRIWEEVESEPLRSGKRWVERARLVDAPGSVQDLDFAPNHTGLCIATCAADGMVRIYVAEEVINIAHWTLVHQFEAAPAGAGKEADGNYCLAWCPSRFRRAAIAVGCGPKHEVKIFRQNTTGNWVPRENLPHSSVVHSVAWAPGLGRSYQLIATGSKDHRVRIFKLVERVVGDDVVYDITLVGNFVDHNAEVWRVAWNVTGTVLASSGDDGKVRLWKATYADEWKLMSVISAEHSGDLER